MAAHDPALLSRLRDELTGTVIGPEDEGYDAARAVFFANFDRRPAAIARVADAADVSRVVSLARETGLELAVRSGGHSAAGYGVSDGGIVLDLGEMRGIEIDAEARTAWAETGLTAREYTAAAAAHGLATPFGDMGSVGIGGLTLGGGVGFLSRKFGLTIDGLLAADVVTADGEIVRADAESHPDLFWAIRGGGGNFGVATRLHLRLYEVDQVVGGMLLLPASAEVIAGFVAAAEAAPEELTAIVNVMPAPPMPFVPEEHHGRLVVMAILAHVGDVDAGQNAVAPFRALAEPLVDMVRPVAYPELFPPEQPGYRPISTGRNAFADGIDHAAAETILEHLAAATAPTAVAQIRVLGGAVARVPDEATAYAHRSRRVMVNAATLYTSVADAPEHEAWTQGLAAALSKGQAGAYVNFVGDEGPDRVREVYPGETWERLAAVKARYDPENVFRLNQNIPPASRAA